VVAQTGLQFDLRSTQGKLIASLMAALAEFEHDLLRERIRSGIAAARKRASCLVVGRASAWIDLHPSYSSWSAKVSRIEKSATGSD
jgi:hypothetical protein